MTTIVWLRNDLRVHDNPALHAAIESSDFIIPVFILDEKILKHKNASANRNRFLLESLDDLKKSLQSLGGDLIIRSGDPALELMALAKEFDANSLHYAIDYTPFARQRDEIVTKKLKKLSIDITAFPGRLLVDTLAGIQTGNGTPYKVFTPFWKATIGIARRTVLAKPTKFSLPPKITVGLLPKIAEVVTTKDLSPNARKGGETAGRKRLHDFLKHDVRQYRDAHNDMAADKTSRLSSYLHFGCISVREVEDSLGASSHEQSFARQLAWRDFYAYILLHYPKNVEQEFQERYRTLAWEDNEANLQAWQQGKTGYPIVDASMRQLNREGWMHNRGRLIVGSFLTKDLGLDWRLGEAYFMKMLIDGDTGNNNGNWQWIASVGVDPAPLFRRLYNPTSQQKNYDPTGNFVRTYVPELAKVPDEYITEPAKMPSDAQKQSACIIGNDYPAPIIDHKAARLATIERYKQA